MEGGPIRPSQQIPLEWFASRGCSVFNGMPEARKKPLRLCHSTLHAHNVRPVRMYRSMSREIPRGPRCVVTRTYPSLTGRIFSLGAAFSPRRGPPQPMMLCVFAASNARSAHPGESSCKCTFWLCAGKTIARYGLWTAANVLEWLINR